MTTSTRYPAAQAIRRFGVQSYDAYWLNRKNIGDTRQTRCHNFLVSLIKSLIPHGGRVLDCGVGPGHVFRTLAEHYETYGVEISDEAFQLYDFDTRRIVQADLNDGIPDFGVRFDAIIVSMLIHHLEKPPAFLQQVRERLALNRYFVPVIPNICYGPFRLRYLAGQFPPISRAHRNFQTAREFEEMVRQADYRLLHRLSPKKTLRARFWPTWFSQDLVYVFQPNSSSAR